MNYKYQRFGVWSGIGFFFLFWMSCVNMMGFVPPPSPTLTGRQLLVTYQEHWFCFMSFWVPVTAFCIYYACMFPLMFKAIKRQELAEARGSSENVAVV